ALAVDPSEPNRIFWGSLKKDGGVYVSEDGGTEWRWCLWDMKSVFDIAVSKKGTVYAAGSAGQPALYRSVDHGKNWMQLYRAEKGDAMEALLIDPKNEERLYAGIVSWNGGTAGRILRSLDAGKSWMDITGSLPASSGPAAMA